MKIAIVGNAGSGKSTAALKLHTALGLPLYHLDQYFWKLGWQEPDRSEFEKIHNKLCDQDAWIIEGMALRFFEYRIQRADIVIFIDMPTYLCFYQVFKRAYVHWGKVYFSSAPGCPERGPSWKFLRFIWDFNKQRKPLVEALLHKYADKKIYILKSQKEIDTFLTQGLPLQ